MIALSALLVGTCLLAGGVASYAEVPAAAKVIREEALRSQQDPAGRPLPLVAHWHRMSLPLSVQIRLIEDGYPILPWMSYDRTVRLDPVDRPALATLRQWGLPLAFITWQWEWDFYRSPDYRGKPLGETGLADDIAGNSTPQVSPFSPVQPWHELGRRWTENEMAKALQAAYPDPPLVLFISNNEAAKLRWMKVETSKSYVDKYGLGQSGNFRRQVTGDGWIARYSALFEGMRAGLTEDAWKRNSRFVGYNPHALGANVWGRWGGWREYSLVTDERVSPEWYFWNGATVEAYDNPWQSPKSPFTLWSVQTEMMNLVFQKQEAYKVQPEFWLELLFWDGNTPGHPRDTYTDYAKQGVSYTPEVYGGWVQYSMWLALPRVAREWRKSDDRRERWWPHFQQILDAVQRVHKDPVLRRFWRTSELVPNRSREHPFRHVLPAKWGDPGTYPRWFHLDTSTDPALPRDVSERDYAARMPVWTMARVLGVAPHREWLIYAHAPLGERTNVDITLPGYGRLSLPRVAVGGSFYHLTEASRRVSEVGVLPSPSKNIQ